MLVNDEARLQIMAMADVGIHNGRLEATHHPKLNDGG